MYTYLRDMQSGLSWYTYQGSEDLPDGFRRHTSGLGEIGRGEVLLVNNQVCVRPSLVGTNDRAQGLWSVALEA